MATVRDKLAVAVFVGGFLLPMVVRGTTGQILVPRPRALADCHNISCLFSQATPSWPVFFVQVRRSGGYWEEVDPAPFFKLRPFGYRSRLDRYLIQAGVSGHALRADLAAWLLAQPELAGVDELRFVGTWIPVRADRPPQGAWTRPALRDIPANHLRVLSTHEREGSP